jgi:D-3-phosphoglycerate dehydrogenase
MKVIISSDNYQKDSPTEVITEKQVKVLLLENSCIETRRLFEEEGYIVEQIPDALNEDELVEKVKDVHVLCIKTRTLITEKVLYAAKKLMVIGAFCSGTNNIDMGAVSALGIPVFHSRGAESRSVAELILGDIILLSRSIHTRNEEMHNGLWNQDIVNSHDIFGKTVGIIGYGNAGQKVAEVLGNIGMKVLYNDMNNIPPISRCHRQVDLDTLLRESDFITIHVNANAQTEGLIGQREIDLMKPTAYLINTSRSVIVQMMPLYMALKSRRIAGGAFDVFPSEPTSKVEENWSNLLQSCPNVILTPHIGGFTHESEIVVGREVADDIIRFVDYGDSTYSLNFPEICFDDLNENSIRLVNFHKNVPGVLNAVNQILCSYNVECQNSRSRGNMSYLMADLSLDNLENAYEIFKEVLAIKEVVKLRIIL